MVLDGGFICGKIDFENVEEKNITPKIKTDNTEEIENAYRGNAFGSMIFDGGFPP